MTAGAVLLQAKGASKCYRRTAGPLQQVANLVAGRSYGAPFWALQSLDLTLRAGEAIGVIGRNGSGKSTLLQLLYGTLALTEGQVTRAGRVAGILELGAAFNPDFTGRENAALNATTLGLSAAQLRDRLPQIEAFAGIGAFFDRPVREYSSGMHARLAFAVAVHVEADILVIDEVLSVGDAAFQQKSRQRMRDFCAGGGALVFVSQNPFEMASVCQRAIWLDQGQVQMQGPAEEVALAYQAHLLRPYGASTEDAPAAAITPPANATPETEARFEGDMTVEVGPFRPEAPQHGEGGARVLAVSWHLPDDPRPCSQFSGGTEIEMHISCIATRQVERPIIGFILRDDRGQNLFGDNTFMTTALSRNAIGSGQIATAIFRFHFPWLPVGRYQIAPSILDGTQQDHVHLHWMEESQRLTVTASPVTFGLVGVPLTENSLTPET